MKAEYINAVEQRLRWLKWAEQEGEAAWRQIDALSRGVKYPVPKRFEDALPFYRDILERGDTFYMAPHFARLVDHTRQTAPDDLKFERTWLQSPCGFLWLDEPFLCPTIEPPPDLGKINVNIHVRAVGWRVLDPNTPIYDAHTGERWTAPSGSTHFGCFQDFSSYDPGAVGFGCWSYFTLRDGEPLGPRVHRFEDKQADGRYATDPAGGKADRRHHPLHEIRWIYAAMYLMARRLAITVKHDTDRATRRRAERGGQEAPPFIRVITLRRLEAARQREAPTEVDWQWQWEVRGHWRNQFYPGEGIHKPAFIESYVKGPPDKPLKPGAIKLFAAQR